MVYNPKNTNRTDPKADTNQIPAVDSARREPPMPRSLPEASDPDGTTGVMPVVSESEDMLRHADDSATASQP